MPIISNNIVRLELVNLETGSTGATRTMANSSFANGRFCETDGILVYASTRFSSIPASANFLRHAPDGNTFILEKQVAISTAFQDVCFDGMYWYGLDSGNVYQAEDPFFLSIVKQWAHGLSGPVGIMAAGGKIGIIN